MPRLGLLAALWVTRPAPGRAAGWTSDTCCSPSAAGLPHGPAKGLRGTDRCSEDAPLQAVPQPELLAQGSPSAEADECGVWRRGELKVLLDSGRSYGLKQCYGRFWKIESAKNFNNFQNPSEITSSSFFDSSFILTKTNKQTVKTIDNCIHKHSSEIVTKNYSSNCKVTTWLCPKEPEAQWWTSVQPWSLLQRSE